MKDERLKVVEEESLPTNNRSSDHVNNDSSDDNNNDDNDDNDMSDTGSYCIFDYCDHEQSDKTLEIPSCSQGYSQEMLRKSSAIFLLGLKEKYKLTQTTVQGIIEGFTNVTQQQIDSLQSQVHYAL